MKQKKSNLIIICALLSLMLVVLYFTFLKSDDVQKTIEQATVSSMDAEEIERVTTELTGKTLGLLSITVPFVAVALAFITQEVVASLFIGLLYGHCMLIAALGTGKNLISYVTATFCGSIDSILDTITDRENASVIILCLVLGGLIELINKTGAFKTLALKMVKRIKNPKQVIWICELLGLAVFFDDYANSLIVGPVMRPIADKHHISREKLAYVVDATASTDASIAIISSWVATEVAAIQVGLEIAGIKESAYNIFLTGIPYNFYNILVLAFIFINATAGRDFGPMLKAENRARNGYTLRPGSEWKDPVEDKHAVKAGPAAAITPIILLCVLAFIGFYFNGLQNAVLNGALLPDAPFGIHTFITAFGHADTVFIILAASLVASIYALIYGVFSKTFSLSKGIISWQKGASGLLSTVIILVLAWSLSSVVNSLGAVHYIVDFITLNVPFWLVPCLIFITCSTISLGIGSYGCMAIVVPMVVPIAYGAASNLPASQNAWQFVACCVASVLSGSVFGDHCSPITDTTILSAIGAGCDSMDHAKTQLPYALTVAVIAIVSGSLLAGNGISPLVSYPIGLVMIVGVLYIFGKKPHADNIEIKIK